MIMIFVALLNENLEKKLLLGVDPNFTIILFHFKVHGLKLNFLATCCITLQKLQLLEKICSTNRCFPQVIRTTKKQEFTKILQKYTNYDIITNWQGYLLCGPILQSMFKHCIANHFRGFQTKG